MAQRYYIGTSGWNYDHWKYNFYPESIARKDWFGYYTGHFDTVEINYSFYRWPDQDTVKLWAGNAPSGFIYTMKAPRLITHFKRLKDAAGKVSDFYNLTSLLKDHAGCHLFQLRPDFKNNENNFSRLEQFLESLDKRKNNAVEFRHSSWWSEEVYQLMDSNKTAFCTVVGLGMPGRVIVTGGTAYFRFHGDEYAGSYSDSELEEWAKQMKNLECRKLYAYFNNDAEGYAPANALKLKEALGDG